MRSQAIGHIVVECDSRPESPELRSRSGESDFSELSSTSSAMLPGEEYAIVNRGAVKNLVFTIGHSNHSAEKFLRLLKGYGIEVLVDTRSRPYSRHAPRFNAHALEAGLSKDGIGYLFLGGELGGRPEGGEFYDAKERVDYALV